MQRLEVSSVVRHIYMSLGGKGLSTSPKQEIMTNSDKQLQDTVPWISCACARTTPKCSNMSYSFNHINSNLIMFNHLTQQDVL
jgi:hypothetical protein